MAYDRYDTRGSSRERWRSDEDRYREHERGRQDERGFFERAGDQIASWFGDDDSDRRRHEEEMREGRGRQWGRERQQGGFFRGGEDRDWNRDRERERGWSQERGRDWGRGEDEPRRPFSAESYRGVSGEGGYGTGSMWSADRMGHNEHEQERGYRPMTGDYGRGEAMAGYPRGGEDRGRSNWDRDDYRRTSFAGSAERSAHHDPHYEQWRRRQLEELDRDYEDYRREHQSKFESDFGSWRQRRMQKRQMAGSIREHMEVVGSDNEHVGTVDRVAGDRIILTKSDPEAGGVHHSLSCTDIDRIEDDRVVLEVTAEQAKQRWRDESRERALFEREDQGQAGPHMLDRSFSGTYR